MICNIAALRNKQVVSVESGTVIGYVSDIEFDSETGEIKNLIVYGKNRLFGILGREQDLEIPWSSVSVVGQETVLIKGEMQIRGNSGKKYFGS